MHVFWGGLGWGGGGGDCDVVAGWSAVYGSGGGSEPLHCGNYIAAG